MEKLVLLNILQNLMLFLVVQIDCFHPGLESPGECEIFKTFLEMQ